MRFPFSGPLKFRYGCNTRQTLQYQLFRSDFFDTDDGMIKFKEEKESRKKLIASWTFHCFSLVDFAFFVNWVRLHVFRGGAYAQN